MKILYNILCPPKVEGSSSLKDKQRFLKKIAPGFAKCLDGRLPIASCKAEFYMKFHFIVDDKISIERFKSFVDDVYYDVLKDVLIHLDGVIHISEVVKYISSKGYHEKIYLRMIRDGEIDSFEDFLNY